MFLFSTQMKLKMKEVLSKSYLLLCCIFLWSCQSNPKEVTEEDPKPNLSDIQCPAGDYPDCPIPCIWQNVQSIQSQGEMNDKQLQVEIDLLKSTFLKVGGIKGDIGIHYLDTLSNTLKLSNQFSQAFIEKEAEIRACFCQQYQILLADSLKSDFQKKVLKTLKECRNIEVEEPEPQIEKETIPKTQNTSNNRSKTVELIDVVIKVPSKYTNAQIYAGEYLAGFSKNGNGPITKKVKIPKQPMPVSIHLVDTLRNFKYSNPPTHIDQGDTILINPPLF